jgi:hypothetical protein
VFTPILTGVTWWFIKPGVSPGERQNRLRQHGALFSFSQKNSQREFFCEKDREFSALLEAISPAKRGSAGSMATLAGSRVSFISWFSWSKRPPRNSCILTGVTRCVSKRNVSPNGGPLRLRQRGTFLFFFTKMLLCEQHFCEKDRESSALPEAKPVSQGVIA